MRVPEWYRCSRCGRSDQHLFANPPCPNVNRPSRGFSNAVQTVCSGCVLWCQDDWPMSSAQASHALTTAEPVALELGL